MTHDISLSNGETIRCFLGVQNVTGIAGERGYRLCWVNCLNPNLFTPALGLATSSPFRLEREAIAYGLRHFNQRAKRMRA